MTIETTQTYIQYNGDGSTTAFPVPFPFFGTDEVVVTSRVIATGVETTLTLGVEYTVTGGNGGTGTVTATSAPAAGIQWTIERATEVLQEIDFQSNGAFPEEAVERGLDRVTAILQEVAGATNRSLRVPVSDPLTGLVLPGNVARANTVLAFDEDGVPYVREIDEDGILAGPAGPAGAPGISWEPGAVRWWPGASIPSGWAVCGGQLYANATYPLLYAAIGRAWTGGGDPADQFRVPDLRGRGVIGLDNMGGSAANRVTSAGSGIAGTTLGATGGSERLHLHGHTLTDPGHTHSATTGAAGAHGHTVPDLVVNAGSGGTIGGVGVYADGTGVSNTASDHTHSVTVTAAGAGLSISSSGVGGSENMPPVAVGNWIIKLDGSTGNGSEAPIEFCLAISDETTTLTTGLKVTWHAPVAMAIDEVILSLGTVSSSGAVTLDVKLNGTTIFSTKVTVDANEETSLTAATPAVLSTTDIPKGGKMTFHLDGVGTGAAGAKVAIVGTR